MINKKQISNSLAKVLIPGLQEAAAKRFDDLLNHKRENELAKSD